MRGEASSNAAFRVERSPWLGAALRRSVAAQRHAPVTVVATSAKTRYIWGTLAATPVGGPMATLFREKSPEVAPPPPAADVPASLDTLIGLTSLAATKVNEIRDAEAIEAEMGLRLRVVGGGCAGFSYDLYFDAPTEVDQQFELAGVKVVVDEMSLMYLVGTEIDYVEGLSGAGFKFQNPNVKSTCGCGSSFSV
jgi:iron-sulfur cluster assembly accessory protein